MALGSSGMVRDPTNRKDCGLQIADSGLASCRVFEECLRGAGRARIVAVVEDSCDEAHPGVLGSVFHRAGRIVPSRAAGWGRGRQGVAVKISLVVETFRGLRRCSSVFLTFESVPFTCSRSAALSRRGGRVYASRVLCCVEFGV